MNQNSRAIVWLRRDLRLQDHRALFEATRFSKSVLPVFIIDDLIVGSLERNDRRITFIQTCLDEIQAELDKFGAKLLVQRGDPKILIPKIAADFKVSAVFTAKDYEPYAKSRDGAVAQSLAQNSIAFHSFKDQVIFEGREILNQSNEPYKVFTPYSRAWLKALEGGRGAHMQDYKPNLNQLMKADEIKIKSTSFYDLGFEPQKIAIRAGAKAARQTLNGFSEMIARYHETRDFPAIEGTSSLSTHFRFGTVSIREAVRFCQTHLSAGARVWLNELIWRDFYHMILDLFPHVVGHAFKPAYDEIQWPGTQEHFQAWCDGRTGYPIVDAAMRQLNQTGWMHNRLRMIVAMFLTKDLLVDWRWGEAYFAKQLLDFDLAANNGGWQWSASTGCDAQPYFRIFNPTSQGEKFDPEQVFIRKFVPEVDSAHYPQPIVDHSVQRLKALQLFKA